MGHASSLKISYENDFPNTFKLFFVPMYNIDTLNN